MLYYLLKILFLVRLIGKFMELSQEVKKEIDHWLTKFPSNQRRSAVVAALLAVQEENGGWIPDEGMNAVAEYLGIPPIEVFEVATFYDMYELNPIGKYKIGLCTNVSCMLRGSDDLVEYFKKRLNIGLGETTPDGVFTLRECECLGACAAAPVCQVNDKVYYEDLTVEKIAQLIDQLERKVD